MASTTNTIIDEASENRDTSDVLEHKSHTDGSDTVDTVFPVAVHIPHLPPPHVRTKKTPRTAPAKPQPSFPKATPHSRGDDGVLGRGWRAFRALGGGGGRAGRGTFSIDLGDVATYGSGVRQGCSNPVLRQGLGARPVEGHRGYRVRFMVVCRRGSESDLEGSRVGGPCCAYESCWKRTPGFQSERPGKSSRGPEGPLLRVRESGLVLQTAPHERLTVTARTPNPATKTRTATNARAERRERTRRRRRRRGRSNYLKKLPMHHATPADPRLHKAGIS